MKTRRLRLGILLLSLVVACASDREQHSVFADRDAIVYGADNRADIFEHPDPVLRTLAMKSVVALMNQQMVEQREDGPHFVISETASDYGLCSSDKFAEQPVVATCSGVLLAHDLVLTAAHCLAESGGDGIPCSDLVLAFDYLYVSRGQLEQLTSDAIYTCRKVLVLAHSAKTPKRDFAVIQLDRPVSDDRKPIAISQRTLVASEALATISFPIGLPAKIDSSARVVDPRNGRGDYFSLTSDVFEGSSGGAVVNSDADLVGFLSSGGNDFEPTDAGCATPVVVPEGEPSPTWEHASIPGPAIDALCQSGWPDPALCHASGQASQGCSIMPTKRSTTPNLVVFVWAVAAVACATSWCRRARPKRSRSS